MQTERDLRPRLRKIEALFAGAGTPGERDAAEAALERIRARLRSAEEKAEPVEMRFSLGDPWTRQLFVAPARRYGLRPYRHYRQRRTTSCCTRPSRSYARFSGPEFEQLSAALTGYLAEVTERIIRKEVHGETGEAEERSEPSRLP
jgi:hypothetical protein